MIMENTKKELTFEDLKKEEIPIPKKVELPKTIEVTKTTPMRKEANAKSKVLGMFPKGTIFELLEELEDWKKVRFGEWIGFIKNEE